MSYSWTMVAPLRILFIALAIVFGIGLTAAAVLGVWDLFQTLAAPAQEPSGGPPPFRFSSYVYTPIVAAIVLLGGHAALKRRWEVLALTCCFLLGTAVLDALHVVGTLGTEGLSAGSVLALFAMLGVMLAATAKSRAGIVPDASPQVPHPDRIRLRNTLVGLAVVSYLWSAVTTVANPGLTSAVAYLRGTPEGYLVLGSIVGLGAGVLLVICVIASFKGSDTILNAALAFIAGLAFEGFLVTLDAGFGFETIQILRLSLQDAVAFLACCSALALSVRIERSASRLTAA